MPTASKSNGQRAFSLSISLLISFGGVLAVCGPTDLTAQISAFSAGTSGAPVIEYAANESGGRIRLTSASPDSAMIDAVRATLFEHAAAFRRGDLKNLKIVRTDLPAVQLLADRRTALRCSVRITARGGELVLLSDDSAVVAAIHQLLAAAPPLLASR